MSLYVLDTDHVTIYQRNQPRVVARVTAMSYGDVAVTLITAERPAQVALSLEDQADVVGGRVEWSHTSPAPEMTR